MEAITLPPKPIGMLLKAIALASFSPHGSTHISFDDLMPILAAASPPPSAAALHEFVNTIQQYMALAIYQTSSPADFTAFLSTARLSAPVKESLDAWWRENREQLLAEAAIKAGTGTDSYRGVSWRVETFTASSTEGASEAGEPFAHVKIAVGTEDASRVIGFVASKAAIADALVSIDKLKRDIEKAAATS